MNTATKPATKRFALCADDHEIYGMEESPDGTWIRLDDFTLLENRLRSTQELLRDADISCGNWAKENGGLRAALESATGKIPGVVFLPGIPDPAHAIKMAREHLVWIQRAAEKDGDSLMEATAREALAALTPADSERGEG